MKTGPTTYSAWTKLLDQFGDGDDSVLEELNNGTFTIDAGTATRFYIKVEEAYKKRKQSWLDKFQFSFQLQNFKTEDDFEIALRNGKQNLSPLSKFVAIESLPDDLKKALKKDLEDFVNEIKTSLKKNNSSISKGREKMLILLNSFDLNSTSQEILMNTKTTNEIIASTGRKIIF
ncbi:hypothetical protein [Flavobacterium bizetiae]|uniref:Uncharacterized protein n=1 Tax=Flavobacterium bizetiae TaxID=2704140 RepID=A0A6J4G9Y8_9FLAO|nr:hypothetical protein [Flavobacterium bizetiae]CAA9195179.1 hypothetical protein FLA105534_00523 [Flavobacterium bizetiae]CAD5340847.1 hypothetical protein FLA105535_00807 [Flavobacterium bizetiae]CAD5347005.1 hypothetical protein FLA105534_00953 [Flavobacterium bizetiae]